MDYRDEPLINVKSKETAYLEYSIYIYSQIRNTRVFLLSLPGISFQGLESGGRIVFQGVNRGQRAKQNAQQLIDYRVVCRVVISNLITRFDNTVARSVKSYRESIFPSYRVCIALNERNCIIERGDRKDIFVWIYSDTYTRIL